ncbi:MAG: polysaccharide deacetylase family protein [Acidobacteriota bacterium]
MALTFDDVPFMKPLGFWRPREVSNMILRTLKKEGIHAAGFVVQEKVEDDLSTYIVLDDWVSQGQILGNQTWGDADLNVLSHEYFLEHATDGQKYLKRLARAHPFNFRYLRFPQLHEGNTKEKKKKVRQALERGDYKIAPVTVKTWDYLFNRPYIENETRPERVQTLKKMYLELIGQSLDYSESQSKKVFGKNISHILQLHTGIATATFLPDLIQMLRNRGYQFISFPEALSDPAFKTEEQYVGPLGLTFIDRVAATRGMDFDENCGLELKELEKRLKQLDRSSRRTPGS